MANKTLSQVCSEVAAAIRQKDGSTGLIKPVDFASKILAIPSGGSNGFTSVTASGSAASHVSFTSNKIILTSFPFGSSPSITIQGNNIKGCTIAITNYSGSSWSADSQYLDKTLSPSPAAGSLTATIQNNSLTLTTGGGGSFNVTLELQEAPTGGKFREVTNYAGMPASYAAYIYIQQEQVTSSTSLQSFTTREDLSSLMIETYSADGAWHAYSWNPPTDSGIPVHRYFFVPKGITLHIGFGTSSTRYTDDTVTGQKGGTIVDVSTSLPGTSDLKISKLDLVDCR